MKPTDKKNIAQEIKDKEILTSTEAQKYFQISKSTFLKMVHAGKLRFFKVGKNYRFKKTELEEDLRGK